MGIHVVYKTDKWKAKCQVIEEIDHHEECLSIMGTNISTEAGRSIIISNQWLSISNNAVNDKFWLKANKGYHRKENLANLNIL